MHQLGIALIVIGFLGGAWVAALGGGAIDWLAFLPLLAIGTVGVLLRRRLERAHAHDDARVGAQQRDLLESLDRVVERLRVLEARKSEVRVQDWRGHIDRELADELARFVEVRKGLIPRYGLAAYADVMSHFASGERYLNRVWSASADGYIDECQDYVTRALMQLTEALARLRGLAASSPRGPQKSAG